MNCNDNILTITKSKKPENYTEIRLVDSNNSLVMAFACKIISIWPNGYYAFELEDGEGVKVILNVKAKNVRFYKN